MASAQPQRSRNTSSNSSSTQTRGSTSSTAAAPHDAAAQLGRQQSIRPHNQEQDKQEPSSRGYEEEAEEEMGLAGNQGFGQKLREAISSPASKILIGIGGAVAVDMSGAAGRRGVLAMVEVAQAKKVLHRVNGRYAVPYDDADGQEIAQRLYRRFRVSTLPHVVLLDSEARVINPQAYASMLMDPAGFPWRKKTLRELLGDTLIRPDGEKVDKSALDNKVLGLYFSASWCPPCQAFTPKLVNAAQHLRDQGKNFEIVFISNDKNEQQFDDYFKKMTSFLAVPFKEANKRALLQETLNVRSLPTLVWVGPDDEILTRNGVAAVTADPELQSFPFREPDVHEVAETVEGIAQEPALILFMEYADPADQQKQQAVIMDLIDQSYYLYKRPAATSTVDETPYFTADEITTFVRNFRGETLERNPLVLPE
ncbi:UNVERIFIED_CONTAM: hypothetical protein H355_006194 [Colinus virginianus]|nr:hypothetical protein H355_006194 [Colinus virginianus]